MLGSITIIMCTAIIHIYLWTSEPAVFQNRKARRESHSLLGKCQAATRQEEEWPWFLSPGKEFKCLLKALLQCQSQTPENKSWQNTKVLRAKRQKTCSSSCSKWVSHKEIKNGKHWDWTASGALKQWWRGPAGAFHRTGSTLLANALCTSAL